MNSEISRIMRMVVEGKINADEGARLIESLVQSTRKEEPTSIKKDDLSISFLTEKEEKFVRINSKSIWIYYAVGGSLIVLGLLGVILSFGEQDGFVWTAGVFIFAGFSNIMMSKHYDKYNKIITRLINKVETIK